MKDRLEPRSLSHRRWSWLAIGLALCWGCAAISPLAAREKEVRLVAVGDIMLARNVAKKAGQQGWSYLFARTSKVLGSGDICFGNLECEIGAAGRPIPKHFSFSAPESSAAALQRAGFTVLSLANNHSFDRGRLGLVHTMEVLRRRGIGLVGAGLTPQAAQQPLIITKHGLRIAFLAYTTWQPEGYLSLPEAPALALADAATVARTVTAAKRRADVVIVSLHWGVERVRWPSAQQRQLARAAIDAGADVVLGHHPHVRQPVEYYRGRPIFFSLGNFVFDQRDPHISSGWIVILRLRKSQVRIERLGLIEIHNCRPTIATWQHHHS